MKTMCKAAAIAICLLIAQTFLMTGPELAGAANCTVTYTGGTINPYDPSVATASPAGCTVFAATSPNGTATTLTSAPTKIYAGSGNDYTLFFKDNGNGNGITFNLSPGSPSYSTGKSITNYSTANLNSSFTAGLLYDNWGKTNVAARKVLTATTIKNESTGTLQISGKVASAKTDSGGLMHVGADASCAIHDGPLTNQSAFPGPVSTGYYHSLGLKSDGTVWAWGSNGSGQLGNGGIVDEEAGSNVPVQVSGLTGIVSISAGGDHSLALKSDGTVWAWGDNQLRQLGANLDGSYTNVPVQVLDPSLGVPLTGVVSIATHYFHSLALKSDGTVVAWGDNQYGQLGVGDTAYHDIPVYVLDMSANMPLTEVVSISAGFGHSLAVTLGGTVWAWGANRSGQLGNGVIPDSTSPMKVVDGTDSTGFLTGIMSVAAGQDHSLALKSDGTVWAWGDNSYGQLGVETGDTMLSNVAVQVSGLTGIVSISAGAEHSLAVTSDKTLWAWGDNSYGQLGNGIGGEGMYSNVPVQVSGLTGIVSVDAQYFDSIVLASDGTVWDWGANWYGELGNGTMDVSFVPVQVSGAPGEWGMSKGTIGFDVEGPSPCQCVSPDGDTCGAGSYSRVSSTGAVDLAGGKMALYFTTGVYTPEQAAADHVIFNNISAPSIKGKITQTDIYVDGVFKYTNGTAGGPVLNVVNGGQVTGPMLIDAVQTLYNKVSALGLSEFTNPPKITQGFLLAELKVIMATIQQGIKNPKNSKFYFKLALAELQNVILPETNGCYNSKDASPDRNDWIKNCKSQDLVYPLVVNCIQLLKLSL